MLAVDGRLQTRVVEHVNGLVHEDEHHHQGDGADAVLGHDPEFVGMQQWPQPAEALQQTPGQVVRPVAVTPGVQHGGKQFGIALVSHNPQHASAGHLLTSNQSGAERRIR